MQKFTNLTIRREYNKKLNYEKIKLFGRGSKKEILSILPPFIRKEVERSNGTISTISIGPEKASDYCYREIRGRLVRIDEDIYDLELTIMQAF